MTDEVAEIHRRNRDQYGTVAANYATSASHAGGDDLGWFRERAASIVPTDAVDVACGGGFSTRALLDAGHRVVGTDLTLESVAAARAAIGGHDALRWVVGAAERLPVRTGSVGLVGCRIAPHHFASIAGFVDEVARVLAPAGLFLVVDTTVPEDAALAGWLDDVERMRDPSHQRCWPASRWQAVLRGAGFDVVETRFTRKRHPMDEWLRRAGCAGAHADAVRMTFRTAPAGIVTQCEVELGDDDTVVAYTDTKVCLRAVRR